MTARRPLPRVVPRDVALLMVGVLITVTACSDGGSTDPTTPGNGRLVSSTPSGPTTGPTSPSTSSLPVSPAPVSSPSTVPPGSAGTTGPPVALGELGVLDAALDDDGTLGLEPALALFAAGYAPVPGITASPEPLIDGGPALRTILAQLDRLGDDQLAAVTAVVDPLGQRLDDVAASDSPRLAGAADVATAAEERFGQLLGRQLTSVTLTMLELPYVNPDGTRNFSSPGAVATALPFGDAESDEYECRIRVNADAPVDQATGFDDPVFLSSVAQEVFHCMQFGLAPFGTDVPMWVMEGAAAFAGEQYAQGSTLATAWWERWITQPQRPLQLRTYDAAGFFFLLGSFADPYGFSDASLGDPAPDSVRRRVGATALFDTWGTQYATEPTWGEQYAIGGDGAPATAAPQEVLELQVDGERIAAAGLTATTELSATAYRFVVPGDVLVVTTDPADRGGIRFGDGAERPLSQATQSFCLNPAGCACPGAPPEAAASEAVGSNEIFIGVGPSSGGGPELSARSLGQWCNEVLVPAPPDDALDQCLARRWATTGYVVSDIAGVRQDTSGGGGAVLDLRPDRSVSVDMNATEPVVITATDANGSVTATTLEYRGAGEGSWSAEGGVINIAGVDTSSFVVRVKIETSGGGQLADNELAASDPRLAGYASLLGTGQYECSPVSMTLTHVTPNIGGSAGFEFGAG